MFIIFAGQTFYPGGGMNDLQDGAGRFKTKEEALQAVANMASIDWWQIAMIRDDELFIVDQGKRA